jgi:hypothetical protein
MHRFEEEPEPVAFRDDFVSQPLGLASNANGGPSAQAKQEPCRSRKELIVCQVLDAVVDVELDIALTPAK